MYETLTLKKHITYLTETMYIQKEQKEIILSKFPWYRSKYSHGIKL